MSYPGAARRGASASRSDGGGTDGTYPRASRLCSRRLFLAIYERGHRASGSYFVLFAIRGATARSRLGITVTKKYGNAVARNRVKRQVREIFRRHRGDESVPIDLVVNVRAIAADQSFGRLESDLVGRLRAIERKVLA